MNITFWNVNKKALDKEIIELIKVTESDVLVLAEYPEDGTQIVRKAYDEGVLAFHIPQLLCKRINIITTSFKPKDFSIIRDDEHYDIRQLKIFSTFKIILISVHLPSKLHREGTDQTGFSSKMHRIIDEVEEEMQNTNTLILGDFNMNPFDTGMVFTEGFHATSCLKTSRKSRKVDGTSYSFFYNPSWSLLGDHVEPPGTCYHRGKHLSYEWNLLDQVIMRPSVAEHFDKDSLRILTSIGSISLANPKSGRPLKSISDHLPITFTLNPSAQNHD